VANDLKPSDVDGVPPFVKRLIAYKEFILILVLFLTAVTWIYGVFATKELVQLNKCLIDLNLQLVKMKLEVNLIRDGKERSIDELVRLTRLEPKTQDDVASIEKVKTEIVEAGDGLSRRQSMMLDYAKQIETGACRSGD